MTDFRDQDLTDATFERVRLRGARFTQVCFENAQLRDVDLSGAYLRGPVLAAMLREVIANLTDEQLASKVARIGPGYPVEEDLPLIECFHVVLNEEWEHRLYAERDLAKLQQSADLETSGAGGAR
jgi:uncharacterized protein YjbI with pentapeptide repeats